MADLILGLKPVAGTIREGRRVTFNQVVMHKDAAPTGVLLVAIDPDVGLLIWLRPQSTIEAIARAQVPDYSDHISINVDSPPAELGEPVSIAKDLIPSSHWDLMLTSNTNALHKIFADALAG
jgi:hypothetical protein